MPLALLPEFFAILGTDILLAMSLLTCLLDKHFPKTIPYFYQTIALAGFGHLMITKSFLGTFGEPMRFWYCFLFLAVAVASVVAANLYLLLHRGPLRLAKTFFGAVTLPAILAPAFFLSDYAGSAAYALLPLPQISLEFTYSAIVTFDVAVIAVCLLAFITPKKNRVALISSAIIMATFISTLFKPPGWQFVATWSAIILGAACAFVLATTIYVFVRMRQRQPQEAFERAKRR
ncbi:MAG: hypothetical protein NWE81_03085 [Candidatus Bathyarchaeota archaeon]|jgi:hypothetical protein|nr:hypothetical protein [Candidatus Bathyarchaeota archaeon]